jgi:hypothetical protein
MFGSKLLLGAVVGGALVYFLDPEHGPGRRDRALAWWEQNREPVIHRASSAASTAQTRASEVGDLVNEKVTEIGSKVRNATGR